MTDRQTDRQTDKTADHVARHRCARMAIVQRRGDVSDADSQPRCVPTASFTIVSCSRRPTSVRHSSPTKSCD